jgi:hypothetical protein
MAQLNDCSIGVAIRLALPVVRVAPLQLSLVLIAGRSSIVAHCGTLARVGTILSRLCAILLGLRLVPRNVTAADHDLRHRRV